MGAFYRVRAFSTLGIHINSRPSQTLDSVYHRFSGVNQFHCDLSTFESKMENFPCTLCLKTFTQKCHLSRHMVSHGARAYACETCSKSYHRLDVLNKHRVKCIEGTDKANTCNLCNKTFIKKSNFTRHKKVCLMKHDENKIKDASEKYRQKLEKGYRIECILKKCPDTMEEALEQTEKECLKLYQSSCEVDIDIEEINLKSWQKEVIRIIDTPSDRTVYWIFGEKGNEGKTFIQNFIHKLFGSRRVLKSEINTRKTDIAYILSQEFLTCKDIFLFSLLRSDTDVAYGLLENIKDGFLISAKYRSKPLKIKTPNTVIVFSNSFPDITKLSTDRWVIFEIYGSELRRKEAKAEKKVNPYESTKNYTAYY